MSALVAAIVVVGIAFIAVSMAIKSREARVEKREPASPTCDHHCCRCAR